MESFHLWIRGVMTVRLFDWRDLPALHRYRDHCLFLDSTRLLTQGPKLVSVTALFSYFAPATGVFTFYSRSKNDSRQVLLGQVIHRAGYPSAHLSFLAPDTALESPALPELVDKITAQVGRRGAINLLAEIEEEDRAFESLRKAGFAIYARQRIWQLAGEPSGQGYFTHWKTGANGDAIGVRSLYCNLVPGLVQQVEPPPLHRLHGLVYKERDELIAYVETQYGPQGIWLQPFFHPDMDKTPERLAYLVQNLAYRRERPVYFCIRSYQSWLETALEDLGAEAGPRQAVLVKRLAIPQKATRSYMLPAIERGQPEVSAPVAQTKCN